MILEISIHHSITGSADMTVRLWRTGKTLINDLKNIDSSLFIAGSMDKTVRLWRTGKRRLIVFKNIDLSLYRW
jgi:hypothetical protein